MIRVFVVVALFLTSGCVANIPLTRQIPEVGYKPAGRVLVSVVDDRKRVRDGKPKTFIGRAHGTFGIPSDWHVNPVLAVEPGDSERDLAQLLRHRLTAGIVAAGWDAVESPSSEPLTSEQADSLLRQAEAVRMILLELKEWFFSINLSWVTAFNFDTDVFVSVFRLGEGRLMNKQIAGRDVIDVEGSQSYRNHILMAYRDQLTEILNDPEVRQALGQP
jgi:hypothetical protein